VTSYIQNCHAVNRLLQWQVAASAFSVLHRLLSSHTVEPENFSKHLVELSTGNMLILLMF